MDRERDNLLKAFGKRVAFLRKARGWSQERLALESGLARSYLGGIENGKRNLSLSNIIKLSLTLNIPVSEFFPISEQRSDLIPGLKETQEPYVSLDDKTDV
ncbi:MAG: helix-turn-helix domain-containing protein [Burkholderiales bacterium]|nr:helix-turn-helix domain-containing protein [Burkholderiales bacterium]